MLRLCFCFAKIKNPPALTEASALDRRGEIGARKDIML